jgi:hypothetical protein
MTPEQITKLAAIEEQLVDVFVEECKPEGWPKMEDKESRGDRYWHKKNALATLTIVGRIQTVLRDVRTGGESGAGENPDDDEGEETKQQEAERLAKQGIELLERHRRRRAK